MAPLIFACSAVSAHLTSSTVLTLFFRVLADSQSPCLYFYPFPAVSPSPIFFVCCFCTSHAFNCAQYFVPRIRSPCIYSCPFSAVSLPPIFLFIVSAHLTSSSVLTLSFYVHSHSPSPCIYFCPFSTVSSSHLFFYFYKVFYVFKYVLSLLRSNRSRVETAYLCNYLGSASIIRC